MNPASHIGRQVAPEGTSLLHVPILPLRGAMEMSHGLGVQYTRRPSTPAVHGKFPETVYPVLQMGWQDCPDDSKPEQVPKPPFAGTTDESIRHGFGMQRAAVSVPAKHKDSPDTVKPASQFG
jgi:hypothetical protein